MKKKRSCLFLLFYSILDFSKHNRTVIANRRNGNDDDDDEATTVTESTLTDGYQRPRKSPIEFNKNEIERILGRAPQGKFHSAENEQIHNEKLLKLAFHVSELTFLQAKQSIIEECLQTSTDKRESHAVIEVCRLVSYKLKIFCLSLASN